MIITRHGIEVGTWNNHVARLSMLGLTTGMPLAAIATFFAPDGSVLEGIMWLMMIPCLLGIYFYPWPLERMLQPSQPRDEREITLAGKANAFAYKIFGFYIMAISLYVLAVGRFASYSDPAYMPQNSQEMISIVFAISFVHLGLPRLYLAYKVPSPPPEDNT